MKKIQKGVVALLICLSLLGLRAPQAKAQVDWEAVRESVFRIIILTDSGSIHNFGSGFAVGTEQPIEYVLTNYHVVKDNLQRIMVWLGQDLFIEAEVAASLPDTDLALLRVKQPIYRDPLVMGSKDMVKVTDEVYTYGYPTYDISNSTMTSNPEDVTVTKGIISKLTTWGDVGYYQIDAAINKGNSGGPLMHSSGYCIGINTMKITESDNINGSIMIEEALAMLDTVGITYLVASPSSQTPAPTPDTQASATPEPVSSDTPTQPDNTRSRLSIWMVIFVVTGLAFLAVAGYIAYQYIRGRRSGQDALPEDEYAPPYAAAPAARRGRPVLRGLSGPYAGVSVPIEGAITIGRDARDCQLVYPKDAPGISRVHCQVRYDAQQGLFMVADYSTNGTLINGTLIGQNMSMSVAPGTRFCLADEGNLYEVAVEE